MSCAKLFKRVQKNEIIDAMLVELRKEPRITNKKLAFKIKVHRNTISKYRKFIRKNYYKTPQETVNKIDSRLDEELEAMSHFALLMYRSQLVPKKTEFKGEITKKVDVSVDIKALLARYEKIIERASNRNLQKDDSRKQVDTPYADATSK